MLPDMSSGRAGVPACMNCRVPLFYAAIINTARLSESGGITRRSGSTGQGGVSSHKRVMQISFVPLLPFLGPP
jgi:hypothetical protein